MACEGLCYRCRIRVAVRCCGKGVAAWGITGGLGKITAAASFAIYMATRVASHV